MISLTTFLLLTTTLGTIIVPGDKSTSKYHTQFSEISDATAIQTMYMQPDCPLLNIIKTPPFPFSPTNKKEFTCSIDKALCWVDSNDIETPIRIICPSCKYGLTVDFSKWTVPVFNQIGPWFDDPRCDHRRPGRNPKAFQKPLEYLKINKHEKRPQQRKFGKH